MVGSYWKLDDEILVVFVSRNGLSLLLQCAIRPSLLLHPNLHRSSTLLCRMVVTISPSRFVVTFFLWLSVINLFPGCSFVFNFECTQHKNDIQSVPVLLVHLWRTTVWVEMSYEQRDLNFCVRCVSTRVGHGGF